jgi:hypothetical protein
VGLLWHLSAAATINAEEARLYPDGKLNDVSRPNTLLHFVLIHLQGDLWTYAFIGEFVVPAACLSRL